MFSAPVENGLSNGSGLAGAISQVSLVHILLNSLKVPSLDTHTRLVSSKLKSRCLLTSAKGACYAESPECALSPA